MVSLTCTKLTLFTIAGVFIQIIGLSLFVLGFFPVKPALSGVSGPESFRSPTDDSVHNESERDLPPDQLRSLYQELSGIPPFHRLIFMVIDGLPAEFVLGKDGKPPQKDLMEAMPYTQSLLSNGMAIGYHAKAASPTVTMPRLKAMVSGAIAGFLDVAFNFNTQALLDDNLLDQFFRIGWKMVMLGDETWLKLFPGLFTRHDGVSSFFVKDTVQVDQNVSRHLPDELSRHDWDLLIMHYLGLDHVGHIGGRNSVLMAPKLKEMDDVIRMIHLSTILNQSNDQEQTLLVVVSDHGMTENGNHGGSSYEETDSLALFVGLQNDVSDYVSSTDSVYQVDIAATLGLLFGVPIPKNNVGVVISEIIRSTLSDERQLRALELNSWQLLRLLQAQLPDLPCGHGSINDLPFRTNQCSDSMENMFCCLYMNATFLHNSWISKGKTRANHEEEYSNIVAVYYEFLRSANEWLSRRLTDQPVNQLAFGVAAMVLSSLLLLSLVYVICKEVYGGEKQCLFFIMNTMHTWLLDEAFVAGVVLIHVLSMSSSSFVEEEHYIWHFVNSTLNLLLLRKVVLYLLRVRVGLLSLFKGQNKKIGIQIITVFVLLISGRILRGWHQGGVNWTYLPDVSKWLARAGNDYIRSLQLISGLLVVTLSFISLYLGSSRSFILVIGLYFIMSGFLIMHHLMKHQHSISGPSTYSSTSLVQIIFAVLGIGTLGIVVTLPWLRPSDKINCILTSGSNEFQTTPMLGEFRNSSYMIGCTYIFSWCLLQLLLQQPVNSMPIFLLLVQMLSLMLYSYYSGPDGKHWAEVGAFYYIGMAGHFALGNSNSLATIDIAGAFIGISNHSTVLSGILMFMITFASPILAILSMVMYIAVKESSYSACLLTVDSGQVLKRMLSFPCLIPLCLNSIFLTANTFMLLLMRNHLFIWSVFSPKYLYACATTVCVYIGVSVVAATVVYTYWVLAFRKRMLGSAVNNKKR